VKIVGISRDPREESARLKQELGLNFPLLSDTDGQVIERYGLVDAAGSDGAGYARPAVLLLDAAGEIRWAMFTENFRVRVRPEALLTAIERLPG
jgi:peroxiredoxin